MEPHSGLLHFARQHLVLPLIITLIQSVTLRAPQEIHCTPPVIITFNNSCIRRSAEQVSRTDSINTCLHRALHEKLDL